nr:hypothetical protein [Tanacetum cinerariifolium]
HIPNISVDYIIFARKWVVYASGFQEVDVRRQDEAFGVNIHLKKVGRVIHCHRCWQSGHNKSKCTNAPKPKPGNFYEIPNDEERKHGSNNVRERDQYQQASPSVDEIPKYREDPVIPESSSEVESSSNNKRKEPPVKKKSSQVNEASGSKSNLTPEEHAEIMDKEAFADLVKKDVENKAKEAEMWRET